MSDQQAAEFAALTAQVARNEQDFAQLKDRVTKAENLLVSAADALRANLAALQQHPNSPAVVEDAITRLTSLAQQMETFSTIQDALAAAQTPPPVTEPPPTPPIVTPPVEVPPVVTPPTDVPPVEPPIVTPPVEPPVTEPPPTLTETQVSGGNPNGTPLGGFVDSPGSTPLPENPNMGTPLPHPTEDPATPGTENPLVPPNV